MTRAVFGLIDDSVENIVQLWERAGSPGEVEMSGDGLVTVVWTCLWSMSDETDHIFREDWCYKVLRQKEGIW